MIVFGIRMGAVFNAETGTSVGTVMGHSNRINSVDFRPARPFRMVTAADDNQTAFFHGPPFQFKFTMQVGASCSCVCDESQQRDRMLN